mgnify:CR=1 FL=1
MLENNGRIPESMNPIFATSGIMVSVLRYPNVGVVSESDPEPEQPTEPYATEIWIETCSVDIARGNILGDFDFLYPEGGESAPDGLKPMTWVFKFKVKSDTYQQIVNSMLYSMNMLLNGGTYVEGDVRVVVDDLGDLHKSRIDRFYSFDRFEGF